MQKRQESGNPPSTAVVIMHDLDFVQREALERGSVHDKALETDKVRLAGVALGLYRDTLD
eukprot:4667843-Amphidinium_carterae.1